MIAFATWLICSASFAPDAHTQVVGETGTVKQITPGCPSYQHLKNLLLTFALAGEKQATDALHRYNCVVLHEGETAIVQERQRDGVCVRRLNDSDCYWMSFDDFKSRPQLRVPPELRK
jgi:hypothetical protein